MQSYLSSNTNKKLMSLELLRGMIPPIDIIAPKRGTGSSSNMKTKMRSPFDEEKSLHKSNLPQTNYKNQEENQNSYKLNISKIIGMDKGKVKKFQKIAQILGFLYNQHGDKALQKQQKIDRTQPKYKVYDNWQLEQVVNNYQDTNLGDFIIKMPNPDLLPQDFKEDNLDFIDKNQVTLFQALEKYDEMLNTENEQRKTTQITQKQAFSIAFSIMCLTSQKNTKSQQRIKDYKTEIITPFEYFLQIVDLSFAQYLQHKKNIPQFKILQQQLPKQLVEKRKKLLQLNYQMNLSKKQIQGEFKKYKVGIYGYLRGKIMWNQNQVGQQRMNSIKLRRVSFVNNGRNKNQNNQNNQYQLFQIIIFKNYNKVSKLMYYFPQFTNKILEDLYIKASEHKKSIQDTDLLKDHIKFHSGGYLTRVSQQGELRWILKQNKPTDLLTLLRKFAIYKLTCEGGLFIREFLSKNENYIFMVVKASQAHLQKMAQKSKFNMQIELGSVDIFSFQPVDKYARPLRCNKYIRDVNFIKKYNLHFDKGDMDEDLGPKSVQSQGLNIYKKAIDMNEDELRSKIILDQQQCDDNFRWVSNKLCIKYILHDEILNNVQNQQQIQSDIWPVYYIYNKMITQSIKKVRQRFIKQKGQKNNLEILNNTIGLQLRLAFLKSLHFCNKIYLKHRKVEYRVIRNLFMRRNPLENIWNQMGEDCPRGYYPYFYSEKMHKMWRKYQINQEKQRSKFTPAARLIITNRIIRQHVNISKSLVESHITNYYPLHDPFILKSIKIRPYLKFLGSLIQSVTAEKGKFSAHPENEALDGKMEVSDNFVEYQCDYTKQDFTKESLQEKLKFKWGGLFDFSVNTIAFYCGEKLAFFFEFRRYLTQKVYPLCLIATITQILFWVQNYDIEKYGKSNLTSFNNVIMIILVLINSFWTEKTVNQWSLQEKKMARSFGTQSLDYKNQQKRILFEGEMQLNFQTNEPNDQFQKPYITIIRSSISLLINLTFIILMASTMLIIFTLKGQFLQLGFSQSTVAMIPTILITICIQIYNFVYSKMIGPIVQFQNKKTVHYYENSLGFKSFCVTFVVTYFVLFMYAFFGQYIDNTLCLVRTTSGTQVNNCYYYMSGQLMTTAIFNLVLTGTLAFYPLLLFYKKQILSPQLPSISYNLNFFQSIDSFSEQQDLMETYMFTDETDKTWLGYTQIVISLTTLVLFAPIVPFLYVLIFIHGLVWLNAKKYQIIFFSKRTLPIKSKSIGIWNTIIRIISTLGVFVNVALIIYVRQIITDGKSIAYFSCVFVILIGKYFMSFDIGQQDIIAKRCCSKTQQLIGDKKSMNFDSKNDNINTDIQNLWYDQRKLNRRLPHLNIPNVKFK